MDFTCGVAFSSNEAAGVIGACQINVGWALSDWFRVGALADLGGFYLVAKDKPQGGSDTEVEGNASYLGMYGVSAALRTPPEKNATGLFFEGFAGFSHATKRCVAWEKEKDGYDYLCTKWSQWNPVDGDAGVGGGARAGFRNYTAVAPFAWLIGALGNYHPALGWCFGGFFGFGY